MLRRIHCLLLLLGLAFLFQQDCVANDLQISGIYPHLTMHNDEGECGTGAVVVWQGKLWAITYAPHKPGGSSDKLYQISPSLEQTIFPGSVGGTPANRMIHPESNQLFIGPYVIDAKNSVRVIPPGRMFGRLTGNARHLTHPAQKIYYATMEEGLYEVDVNSLKTTCLIQDGNRASAEEGIRSQLPGYHGKGLYSAQNRLVYANNGEHGQAAQQNPTTTSGALAEWFGTGDWQLVRRNQFTEVTGPGGLYGNQSPDDPVWALGWDARSLILALLENSKWHYFRLPKGSHSYDGAHGWNTEWPRIREIGEDDLLATMHGTFWRFPADFSSAHSSGIEPRSNYLKVVGDFCRWNDRLVLGCDDSAKSEFLNTRPFKAKHASPGESNSNLWFVSPAQLDHLGPAIGRGSVWLRDNLTAGQTSDPYLFSGYDHRQLYITHQSDRPITFRLEIDADGTDEWTKLKTLDVGAGETTSVIFTTEEQGAWIRLTAIESAERVTASFHYRNADPRTPENDGMFSGFTTDLEQDVSYGLMRSLSHDRMAILAADNPSGDNAACYELNQNMEIVPVDKTFSASSFVQQVSQPAGSITIEPGAVVVAENGQCYRLPLSLDFHQRQIEEPQTPGQQLSDFLDRNLANGAQVSASTTHQDYLPEHIVDGKLTDESRWIGKPQKNSRIEIDLGSEKNIRQIWIVSGWQQDPQYALKNFDVQFRRDNQWTTIPEGMIRDNRELQTCLTLTEQITTQQLRLTSLDSDYARIYEVVLLAEPVQLTPDLSGYSNARICREVATERDLLNVQGTFYELPARNAQGVAKLRPVATHNLHIHDFCSHNGLLCLSGIESGAKGEHIFRSEDGRAAIWAGVVDDLWKLGKPRGVGGPWHNTRVQPNQPSDPYLMTAYDRKTVELKSSKKATIRLEVDIDGTGLWIPYKTFHLKTHESVTHEFATGFSAYWIRAISDAETVATVTLTYQ